MYGKTLLTLSMALSVAACSMLPGKQTGCPETQPGKHTNSTDTQPSTAKPTTKPEDLLASGVQEYEDGDYKKGARLLQSSLNSGLASKSDQAKAYKYLAFINCVRNNEKTCRDMFKKAFVIAPKFTLTPSEAGHPVWGPVYKSVKAEMSN